MATLTHGQLSAPVALTGLDGKPFDSIEALSRGPLLLAFFKVSCPTCQYAFPFIERLYQHFRAKGIQVWGISQDDAKASQLFAREYGITFPILIDDYPYETSRAFGLQFVPTLFLVKPDNTIELMSDGFAKTDLLALQEWFAKHFATSPPPLFLPSERVPEFKPG